MTAPPWVEAFDVVLPALVGPEERRYLFDAEFHADKYVQAHTIVELLQKAGLLVREVER